MPNLSTDLANIENEETQEFVSCVQEQKTQRTKIICGSITASLFILAVTAIQISGQWCDFAKKRTAARRSL